MRLKTCFILFLFFLSCETVREAASPRETQRKDEQPAETVRAPAKSSSRPSNEACYVCHLDFEGEKIVETHLAEGITCADCHGASEKHIADEAHQTPPEVVFKRSAINDFCEECHSERENCPFKDTAPKRSKAFGIRRRKVCTDCHGNHKITE